MSYRLPINDYENTQPMPSFLKLSFFVFVSVLGLSAQDRGAVPVESSDSGASTTRALVVGISDYENNGVIQDLKFADRDALEFAKFLKSKSGGSLQDDQIRLLINQQATGAQLNAALDWLISETRPGERVVIYFAGHGAAESKFDNGFLLCYDSPSNLYSYGNFSTLDLNYKVQRLLVHNKARVHLIIDACRSGKLSEGGSINDILTQPSGSEVRILSCQPNEFSMEGPQWGGGRGAFSFHLIEGLYGLADRDENEKVALFELERYVQDQLLKDLATSKQFPKAFGDPREILSVSDDSVLLSLKQQKDLSSQEFQVSVARSFEDAVLAELNDSTIRETYIRFKQRIENKKFLDPEGDCAEYYFRILQKEPRLNSLHGHIRRVYAAALQDESQKTMNRYLASEVQELTRMKKEKLEQYKDYPQWIQRAAELIDPADPWHQRLQARQFLFEGILLYLKHLNSANPDSIQAVVQKFRQSIQLQKENPLSYFYLSNLFALTKVPKGKNWDSCYHYAQLATLHAKDWILPYAYFIHHSCKEFKDHTVPESWIERAWQLDSTHVFLLKSLGNCQFNGSAWNEAISYYQKALQSDSTDATLYINLGAAYQSLDKKEEAEHYFHKSIQINPKQTRSYLALGFLYYTSDRLQEAEENYRMAEQNGSDDPKLFGRQALVYMDLGKWDLAESKCDQLERWNPDNWRPWYYRACLSAARSQPEKALEYLEKALELGFPDESEIYKKMYFKELRETESFQKLMEKFKNK